MCRGGSSGLPGCGGRRGNGLSREIPIGVAFEGTMECVDATALQPQGRLDHCAKGQHAALPPGTSVAARLTALDQALLLAADKVAHVLAPALAVTLESVDAVAHDPERLGALLHLPVQVRAPALLRRGFGRGLVRRARAGTARCLVGS